MRDLQGLALTDFEKKGLTVLGRAEIDIDGSGNFVELEGVTDFTVNSNITNLFLKTCALSFNLTAENTNDKYSLFDKGSSHYNWVREGRKVKLYVGIRDTEEDDYYWSWIYGIIDQPTTTYSEGVEILSLSGRDYIAYLSENYIKNRWWGKQRKYNIIGEKEKYDMPSDCEGIYKVYLKRAVEGETKFIELTLNSEYTYDWEYNELVFLHPSVPQDSETGGIWVYYLTAQTVENVVADLLIEAGLMTHSEKQSWLGNDYLVTPTGRKVNRCYFEEGTTYLRAIEMLAERTIYRFYVNTSGQSCFRRIPVLLSETVKRLDDGEYLVRNIEERLDELYNHFLLEGEKREMKRINLSVTASNVEDIETNKATLVGGVWADGLTSVWEWERTGKGATKITQKGFKWRKSGEAEQSWYTTNSAMGIFTHTITGLDASSVYEWCVFVKNSYGHFEQTTWNRFTTEAEV